MRRERALNAIFVCSLAASGCKPDASQSSTAPMSARTSDAMPAVAASSTPASPRVLPSRELCARYHARMDATPMFDASAEYCTVVKDGCCLPPTSAFPRWSWNCNNARYLEWFMDECGSP